VAQHTTGATAAPWRPPAANVASSADTAFTAAHAAGAPAPSPPTATGTR